MTDLELGWFAGIVDGEGCISIIGTGISPNDKHRRTPHYRLCLSIMMCHLPTIERIQKLTGVGTIIKKKYSVYAPYNNDGWLWRCSNRQCETLLRLIAPHLITKAEEIPIALEFADLAVTKFCKGGVPPDILAKRIELYHRLQDIKPRSIARRRGKEYRAMLTPATG